MNDPEGIEGRDNLTVLWQTPDESDLLNVL